MKAIMRPAVCGVVSCDARLSVIDEYRKACLPVRLSIALKLCPEIAAVRRSVGPSVHVL